jgi:hypothetical protein
MALSLGSAHIGDGSMEGKCQWGNRPGENSWIKQIYKLALIHYYRSLLKAVKRVHLIKLMHLSVEWQFLWTL